MAVHTGGPAVAAEGVYTQKVKLEYPPALVATRVKFTRPGMSKASKICSVVTTDERFVCLVLSSTYAFCRGRINVQICTI